MKKERTPQKKKDTEEETRKEEKPSDTYRIFLFVLTAFETSELQKTNPHVSKPLQVVETSHHLPPRGSPSLSFISCGKLCFRMCLVHVPEFSS